VPGQAMAKAAPLMSRHFPGGGTTELEDILRFVPNVTVALVLDKSRVAGRHPCSYQPQQRPYE
jgi:hypothetical protein